jgi:membrane fusion protein (multidrug efflux system)
VVEILVSDNQWVKAGVVLARLDPEPFQKAVDEAEASMQSEEGRLTEAKAQIMTHQTKVVAMKASLARTRASEKELIAAVSARQADVQAKSAGLDQSRLDLSRAEKLSDLEVIPKSRYDRARTAFEVASATLTATEELKNQAEVARDAHKSTVAQVRAQVKAEQAALQRAQASLSTQKGQITRRKAQVESARLRLSYTALTAPADGFVTRLSAEVGNTVQAGQPLMSLVNLKDAYVVANYKETHIGRLKRGQKVTIKLDSYPGRKFTGTLDSIMAGTGAAFTLFPPENASGNYVKVVQRIPVKITFDDLEEVRPLLRIGMSVVPTILAE